MFLPFLKQILISISVELCRLLIYSFRIVLIDAKWTIPRQCQPENCQNEIVFDSLGPPVYPTARHHKTEAHRSPQWPPVGKEAVHDEQARWNDPYLHDKMIK